MNATTLPITTPAIPPLDSPPCFTAFTLFDDPVDDDEVELLVVEDVLDDNAGDAEDEMEDAEDTGDRGSNRANVQCCPLLMPSARCGPVPSEYTSRLRPNPV